MFNKLRIRLFFLFALVQTSVLTLNSTAQLPPRREQICLNGTWISGFTVPQYGGIANLKEQAFERDVTVPISWKGKNYKLEFGAVNFIADIYVNNKHVGGHVGGWIPFSTDITNIVAPGETFRLKVNVKGAGSPPVENGKGSYNWPVGGWSERGGIADDVWLRAYGEVYIDDAFIQTSFRKKELSVDYSITNSTKQDKSVTLTAKIARSSGRSTELTLEQKSIKIPAEKTVQVKLSGNWETPTLWWPDNPALYIITSEVVSDNQPVDKEKRRFGFREFWINGNQIMLNGVRINLYGDYQSFASTYYTSPDIHTPRNWPATINQMKEMNIRILRFHHNPAPQYILDIADEKGLLICDESAHYGRKYLKTVDRDTYVKNGREWIKSWIKADRNHPCVYMWNATNEMTYGFVLPFSKEEILSFGDAIREMDTTRLIGYDGEKNIGDSLIDYHYPEGYNNEPKGSIYSWATMVDPAKPTGSGELLHTKSPLPEVQANVERNTWWLGIWIRGMRYTNWTNVKPACFWFTQADLNSNDPLKRVRTINLRNAFAPIALFDKAYDDLGISPFVSGMTPGGTFPSLKAGSKISRNLVLYNDEFSCDTVRIEVSLQSDGKILARSSETFRVPLGEHIEINCDFQVPNISGIQLELNLKTFKKGRLRFEEGKRFMVIGNRPSDNQSDKMINMSLTLKN